MQAKFAYWPAREQGQCCDAAVSERVAGDWRHSNCQPSLTNGANGFH